MMTLRIVRRVAAAAMIVFGSACASAAAGVEITIRAGEQARPAGPMCWKPAVPLEGTGACFLVAGGESNAEGKPFAIPAQRDAAGRLWWWSPAMAAGQSAIYRIVFRPTDEPENRVRLEKTDGDVVEVKIGGKPFTAFRCAKSLPKPFLYPVIGPTGDPVTRDYAMVFNAVEEKNKRQDHPHHRSIWTAHGDVRTKDFDKKGANYWNEEWEKEKKDGLPVVRLGDCDKEIVTGLSRVAGGPVFGQIEARIDWTTRAGERQLTETRTYTFFAADDDSRVIDVTVSLHFTDGDVMFADTKEGGMVALRLAVTMDEQGADGQRGQARNANGTVGAKAGQCWGKPAAWCDYVGPVNGKTVGVAVFDARSNFRHPTTWHIRDYGLYTANPFGLRDFTGDKSQNGSKVWKKGETAEFRYRIVIHKGDTKAARIAEQYGLFAEPPTVSVR